MSHTKEYAYFTLQLGPSHNWPKGFFICVATVWVYIKNNASPLDEYTRISSDAVGSLLNCSLFVNNLSPVL